MSTAQILSDARAMVSNRGQRVLYALAIVAPSQAANLVEAFRLLHETSGHDGNLDEWQASVEPRDVSLAFESAIARARVV